MKVIIIKSNGEQIQEVYIIYKISILGEENRDNRDKMFKEMIKEKL